MRMKSAKEYNSDWDVLEEIDEDRLLAAWIKRQLDKKLSSYDRAVVLELLDYIERKVLNK